MRILDMTAGYRGIWWNQWHPDVTYLDLRIAVEPDVVADVGCLPFAAGVFDPPHVNGGANSNISRDYGHYTASEIKKIVEYGSAEAWRVTTENALMAFKWNNHDIGFTEAVGILRGCWQPLFGQVTSVRKKHVCRTEWMMFNKRK